MTVDILGKLEDLLSEPIDSECKVVYLLAQVRKLCERENLGCRLPSLWMYCHWALHVDLERPRTTEDFLRRVDRWVTNTVAYLTPQGSWSFRDEYNLFKDFVYLNTFRSQLQEFLAARHLPATLCSDDDWWNRFIQEYSEVIEDGSLSATTKNSTLSAVDKVVFEKGADLPPENHVPFVIRWTIHLKDGRTLRTSFQTDPAGTGNMTSHHLEVINNGFVPPVIPNP